MNIISTCNSPIRYLQIITIDQAGIILSLNNLNACTFGSIGKNIFVGKNYLNHCKSLGISGALFASTIEKVSSNELSSCLLEFEEHVDNILKTFEVSITPDIDFEDRIIIVVVDITESKEAQKQLLHTKLKYKGAAIENENFLKYSVDIICLIDEQGRFVSISEACKTIWGYKPEEMLGKFFIDFIHIDDRQKSIDEANRIMDGTSTIKFENRYIHKDGHPVDMMWSANWFEGTKTMFCVARDNTEKIKNDSLLLKLNAELQSKTQELQNSNTELERFAYVASHDLQEPLRMISSFLELLEKKYGTGLDEQAKKYIFFARDGAHRMKTLISDLLDYARIGSEKASFESVDPNKIFSQIFHIYNNSIKENNIKINLQPLPHIYGVPSQLLQLFQNLFGNSIKYLNNRNEIPQIDISYTENNSHWIFSIKDNGIGIEGKFLNKIFVLFQRLHNKAEYSGTGIGLSISKKISERHGGRIWVESTINVGSTFFVSISKKINELI